SCPHTYLLSGLLLIEGVSKQVTTEFLQWVGLSCIEDRLRTIPADLLAVQPSLVEGPFDLALAPLLTLRLLAHVGRQPGTAAPRMVRDHPPGLVDLQHHPFKRLAQ